MKSLKNHIVVLGMGLVLFAGVPFLEAEGENPKNLTDDPPNIEERYLAAGENALLPVTSHFNSSKVAQRIRVVVTAYSSTTNQTDSTPFITASGARVRDGIVAANFLPIGTLIKLPEIYGDRVFVVEDRMHPRKGYQIDIWFAETQDALNFGAKRATIEVLEG